MLFIFASHEILQALREKKDILIDIYELLITMRLIILKLYQ